MTRAADTAADPLIRKLRPSGRNEPVLARAPSTAYRARKFVRRHDVGVAAASLITLALATGVIASTVAMMQDPDLKSLHGPEFNSLLESVRRNEAGLRASAVGAH